jgi:hypothetical protein
MQALARRPGGLPGSRAGLELPVGHSVGIGFQHDDRPVEDQRTDLDPALQQGPPGRRGSDPLHLDHLGALGADGIGEMHAAGTDPGHRQEGEPEWSVDHQFPPGSLLHRLLQDGLVGVDVEEARHHDRRDDKRRNDGSSDQRCLEAEVHDLPRTRN